MISLAVNTFNKVALFPQGAGIFSKNHKFSKTYVKYDIESAKSLLITSRDTGFLIKISSIKYVQIGKFTKRIFPVKSSNIV